MYIYISSRGGTASTYFPDSQFIRLYHPSHPAGLPEYVLYSHRTVEGKFLLVDQHWHVHLKSPYENVTYVFVLASLTVSRISYSSYLVGFKDGW